MAIQNPRKGFREPNVKFSDSQMLTEISKTTQQKLPQTLWHREKVLLSFTFESFRNYLKLFLIWNGKLVAKCFELVRGEQKEQSWGKSQWAQKKEAWVQLSGMSFIHGGQPVNGTQQESFSFCQIKGRNHLPHGTLSTIGGFYLELLLFSKLFSNKTLLELSVQLVVLTFYPLQLTVCDSHNVSNSLQVTKVA